jgi:hypothetical protein
MPDAQKAALVIHEAVIALSNLKFPESRSRQVVASVFNEAFRLKSSKEIFSQVAKLLPSTDDLLNDPETCVLHYPGDYCANVLDRNSSILVNPSANLFTPYFRYSEKAPRSGWSSDTWAFALRDERFYCEATNSGFYERVSLRALTLDVRFLTPERRGRRLPPHLQWEYKPVLVFDGARGLHVDTCMAEVSKAPLIRAVQRSYLFSE